MDWYIILLIIVLSLITLTFLLSLTCFFLTFYSKKRTPLKDDEYRLIPGKVYEEYHEEMLSWMKKNRAMDKKILSVKSFDGLNLYGEYYECKKGAPIEILFNGYRGDPERDMSGAVERCFSIEHNVVLACQRACGKSDGSVVTFGAKESKDCLTWIDYVIKTFGKDVKIIIGGVSMGGSTVLMAAANELPKNVKYVLADCAFSSQKDIIKKVIRQIHLPAWFFYPFIKLSAKLFGGFSLEKNTPLKAVTQIKIPVIFFHGDSDDFVPFYMAEELYEKCSAPKKFLRVSGAGHGLAFPKEKEKYVNTIKEFIKEKNVY